MNVLVTLDKNYIPYLNVMITSLLNHNKDSYFYIYLLHSSIEEEDVTVTRSILETKGELIMINAEDINLEGAPTTSRYPKEIYYRIFAAKYLPDTIDRILYLDPDIIVNGSLKKLYDLPLENYFFAAASHTGAFLRKFNEIRLDMEDEALYINSGVMLMNLELLRKEQNVEDVFEFIEKRKNQLILPDQDIISSLYGTRIYALDTFIFNMTENLFRMHAPFEKKLDLEWVENNSVIIHYCGRNKPWKETYVGVLNKFYNETVSQMKAISKKGEM